MVTVFDMASGEMISAAGAEPATNVRQYQAGEILALQLQPVDAETCPGMANRAMPVDIADLSVEHFLAKQAF